MENIVTDHQLCLAYQNCMRQSNVNVAMVRHAAHVLAICGYQTAVVGSQLARCQTRQITRRITNSLQYKHMMWFEIWTWACQTCEQ